MDKTRNPKTGRFFKGFTPWNKGLTSSDPRVKNNNNLASKTFRKKYADGKIKQPWNKGKTKLEDPRLLSVSQALTGIKRRPESVEKSRINAGKRIKEQYDSGERRWWGFDPKNKEIWGRVKLKFGDEESRQKAFLALSKKFNRLEQYLNKILQENFPNQWKYTGDGTFMVGRKFPDFVFLGNQKKVILLNGVYWHTKFKGWEDTPEDRVKIEQKEKIPYLEFGYEVLHIWEDELASFTKGGKYIFDKDIKDNLDKIKSFV